MCHSCACLHARLLLALPSIAYFYTSIEAQRNLSSTRGTHLLQQNPNPQLIQRPITHSPISHIPYLISPHPTAHIPICTHFSLFFTHFHPFLPSFTHFYPFLPIITHFLPFPPIFYSFKPRPSRDHAHSVKPRPLR